MACVSDHAAVWCCCVVQGARSCLIVGECCCWSCQAQMIPTLTQGLRPVCLVAQHRHGACSLWSFHAGVGLLLLLLQLLLRVLLQKNVLLQVLLQVAAVVLQMLR